MMVIVGLSEVSNWGSVVCDLNVCVHIYLFCGGNNMIGHLGVLWIDS
jgi:hypothetical protein